MMKKDKLICLLLFSITVIMISCNKDNQTLYRVQKEGLFGFISKQGNMIIEPQYKYVGSFTNDNVALVINELKLNQDSSIFVNYGFINKKNLLLNNKNTMKIGKNVVSYWNYMDLYELVEEFNNGTLDFRCQVLPQLEFRDGLYLYQEKESTEKVTIGDQTVELPSLKIGGDLFGYKDIKNNIVIEAQYGVCNEFHNGIAIVKMPTHEALAHNYYLDTIYLRGLNIWGAINTSGEKVIDYEYFYIQDYIKDGTTWAMTISMDDGQFRKEWVSIDKNGKIIAGPLQYNIDWIYNNDKFPIIAFDCILGVYYTFIDKKGSLLTDFDNDGIISLPLRENGERSELFKDVIMFSNDVAGAYGIYMDKEGWYYINKDFSVLSTVYDSIHAFSENMAAVKELQKYHSGKWGYIKKDPIDNTFIQAIPFSFSECGDFINGLAYFSNKGNAFNVEGYINTNGEVIWQTKRKKF